MAKEHAEKHCNRSIKSKKPVKLFFTVNRNIIAQQWLLPPRTVSAEPLAKTNIKQAERLLLLALRRYPLRVLHANIDSIYMLSELELQDSGIVGGTIFKNSVYISNTLKGIEETLHHELAHILYRNYSSYFDTERWQSINNQNENYYYWGSGSQANKEKRNSKEFDPKLNIDGFLNEYATADIHEDFAVFLENIFIGNQHFWLIAAKYERIWRKTLLALNFYHKIDPLFNNSFFESIRKEKIYANS